MAARAAANAKDDAADSKGWAQAGLFIPSVLCGYMAYWQYERKSWKEELINLRAQQMYEPPVDVFTIKEPKPYQVVSASGVFQHDTSIFVGPRPRSFSGRGIEQGYLLVTPLYDKERRAIVMVNRGWVPAWWKDDFEEVAKELGDKRVTVTGVCMPSENPSSLITPNSPEEGEFTWFDVPALAKAFSLPEDTPLVMAVSDNPNTIQHNTKTSNPLIESNTRMIAPTPATFPIPKNVDDLTRFGTMPHDHVGYAICWAILTVVLAIMARQMIIKPVRRTRLVQGSGVHAQPPKA